MKNLIVSLIIFLVFVRLALFLLPPSYTWDETIYLSMAEALKEKGYGWVGGFTDWYRAPALVLTLSLPYFISIGSELTSRLIALSLSIFSIALVYLVASKTFNKKVALFAALFLASNHLHLFFSLRILPENLFGIILLASAFTFWLSIKNKKYLIPLGILVALSFLTRYSGIAIVVPFFIYLTISKQLKSTIFSKYFVLAILVFLLSLSPWMIFNLKVCNNFLCSASKQVSLHSIPIDLTLKSLLGFGFTLPFFIYVLWKRKFSQEFIFILIVMFVTIFLQDIESSDMRYTTPYMTLASLLVGYSATVVKNKTNLFVLFCILNAIVGIWFITKYYFPSTPIDEFTRLINPRSFYTEYNDYKDAGLFLRNITKENETVMTNAYTFVWWYAHRKYVDIPMNYEEFKSSVEKNHIDYVYVVNEQPKQLMYDYLRNYTQIYSSDFATIFKVG